MRNDENARKKISESLKRAYKEGRRKPVSFPGESNPFYGKRHSDITKKRISDTKVGNSPAWNKNTRGIMTAWNKGKKLPYPIWNKGKKVPQQSGTNHWNWKGGTSKGYRNGYYSLGYKNWRRKVFERDSFTCQGCGVKGNKKYLTVHHIKSFVHYKKLRYELSNGITLCESCHSKTDNYKGRAKRKIR
ncbi:TPA: HNH endonuclease [Candidatus Micrarchaeota archaeon]|nr:HNH endonuclease [Candidatus Micrarchaeota archaeon]